MSAPCRQSANMCLCIGGYHFIPHDNHQYNPDTDIKLMIGAFGSGEHETTASCIEIVSSLTDIEERTVLDVGSGTGILSLAALKSGAKHATCIDIDQQATRISDVNFKINGFEKQGTHIAGTIDTIGDEKFDLILANIYGDLLIDLSDKIVGAANSGALILLSGMLWEYNFDVRQFFERLGCEVVKNRMMDEFSTTLLRKG